MRISLVSKLFIIAVSTIVLNGCATVHYLSQAANGESDVLKRARPIDDVIADPATPLPLADKLRLAETLRAYAISELKLPDNASYTRYADLGRPYVLWNVVSTPALSLSPKQSCFPIVGCVAYRGYYVEGEARSWATDEKAHGDDVFMYGVPAYSTLGWFADPLLNSTARYDEISLARLIFHELAHQIVYVKGDSAFNEAFATSVELEGIERWLAMRNNPALTKAYQDGEVRQAAFQAMMQATRDQLAVIYAGHDPDEQKLAEKKAVQAALLARYQTLKASWGGFSGYDAWFAPMPNNAHFASLATYHALVPAFRELIREKNGDLPAFYAEVKTLAQKNGAARDKYLAALSVSAESRKMQLQSSSPAVLTSLLR
ncbi:MAG: aminopeptidase [Burkholderiales bacterium]|nr:aminopeptidase [Burkholderiales bacterium]